MMNFSKKCIRSFRVAQKLMSRGHIPKNTERSRKSDGFIVFVFECTPAFASDFEQIMQEIAHTKN